MNSTITASLLKNIPSHNLIESWKALKNASSVALLTHYKPDGDGISSAAALEIILKACNPHQTLVTIYPTKCEMEVLRHPSEVLINTHTVVPDVVVALDTANYDRLYYPADFKKCVLINIDHHVSNSITGNYNFVVPTAASTCELLAAILKTWCPEKINQPVAHTLLYGMMYDTQFFQTQSTTATTVALAAELMQQGATLYELKNMIFPPKKPSVVNFWGMLLTKIHFSKSSKAAWITVSNHDLAHAHLTAEALGGFNNFFASLIETDIIAIINETPDQKTKISLRSKQADVNALAQLFGGGGHRNAAGALCSEPLAVIEKKLAEHVSKL